MPLRLVKRALPKPVPIVSTPQLKEADETASEIEDKVVLNAGVVANAHAVEHYEMCRYGTLIAWAEKLGHDGAFPDDQPK